MYLLPNPVDTVFTFWEMLINLGLSYALSLIIVLVYRRTHWGTSYSQSFTQSLAIMGCVVAAIMMIIGSNVARAFSLVGAMSVVRYRNAVKDSRDTAFVFFVLGVGMACGTRFYLMAVTMTFLLGGGILFMDWTQFGYKKITDKILRIQVRAGLDYRKVLGEIFNDHAAHHEFISLDTLEKGESYELVYKLRLQSETDESGLVESLLKANEGAPLSLLQRDQQVEI